MRHGTQDRTRHTQNRGKHRNHRTIQTHAFMLELPGVIGTLGGEIILGEEDIMTSNKSEEVAMQVSCMMTLGSKREVGDLRWIKVINVGYGNCTP